MTPPQPRHAWAVWGVALGVYFVAVLHRSSMAVAGLVAVERFGIAAAQLAAFVTLQLVLYTSMQVPAGVLLDRFGSRRLLLVGTVLMAAAQCGFAFAGSYGVALVCRVLIGLGDALIFISVLRLVNVWFAPRRIPLVTQLTGVIGQAGALVAAVPMTLSFEVLGWSRTYLILGASGLAATVALLLGVRDAPDARRYSGESMSSAHVRSSLAEAWRHPGTRLGFWTHFTPQFSATTLALLWGFPYFVRGEGLSERQAGGLLTLLVVALVAAGPVLGVAISRRPYHRSTLVLGIIAAMVIAWTVVLLWPGPAPLWLLVLLVVVVAVGAPTSMIGFDFSRSFNPLHRLGAANGIVNQGGFLATLILVVAIGLILDWRTPDDQAQYTPEAFVWALSFQYVLWTLGVVQIWRYRRRTRALTAAE